MNRIKLAVVGLGKIARDQHLPNLAASDAFALVATVDPAGGLPSVPAYADLDRALDAHPDIQAVAVCTPPTVRAELAGRALQRGCHVLLEKPPAVRPEQLDELRERARARGVTLFAAWHSRYAAAVAAAREALRTREVLGAQVRWNEDHRVWHPGQAWLWRDGGFGVLDPGINALSILTHILPMPLTFVDAALDCPTDSPMPVAARITLAGANVPVELALDFGHAGEPCWDIVVDTRDGQLVLSQGGACLSIDGRPCPIAEQSEYAALYTHYAELIRSGEQDADGTPLALAQAVLGHGRRRAIDVRVLSA